MNKDTTLFAKGSYYGKYGNLNLKPETLEGILGLIDPFKEPRNPHTHTHTQTHTHRHTHTQRHTHTHIYIYICMYISL